MFPRPLVTVPEVVYSCHKCVHVSTFSVMYASFDIIFWNLVFVLCTYVHICVYCRAGPFMNGSKLELVSPWTGQAVCGRNLMTLQPCLYSESVTNLTCCLVIIWKWVTQCGLISAGIFLYTTGCNVGRLFFSTAWEGSVLLLGCRSQQGSS